MIFFERLRKYIGYILPVALMIISLTTALPVHAQPVVTQNYPTIAVTPQGVVTSMCTVVNWLFYFLIVLSVVMVLVAAYLFVTAGDDAEKVSKARKIIMYAAIGIVVALVAKGFPSLIASFVGAQTSNISCS